MQLHHSIGRLLAIPTTDPDDARRRKLLTVILLVVATFTLFLFVGSVLVVITHLSQGRAIADDISLLFIASLGMLIGSVVIFVINRAWSGEVASALFLVLLVLIATFSDQAVQVVDGRGLFIFAIPILMASMILRPYASFFVAALSSVAIALIGISIGYAPNIPAMIGFFSVALVSWLSARTLEQALADLRATNRDLDRRVAMRTHDLAEALIRVQTESGKIQAILESIADGVIVFDMNRTAAVANPAITHLLGLPPEDILGHSIMTLTEQHMADTDREKMAALLQGGVHEPSAKLRWDNKTLSVSFAPILDGSEHHSGMVVVFRDFTREAELDRMKSTFVSMASHELRTPLNAILGYTDMLKVGVYGALSDDQQNALERIAANTKRMLGLVNNLLDQAQIEAGKLTLYTGPFAIHDLLADLEATMGVLAISKGVEFSYTVENLPDVLLGDPQRLNQILVNLVGNAIKFTDQGYVRVRAYRSDETHWALQVSDTGAGIPKEAHSYIFEAFRQVDDPITRKYTGSGLGLSIVKQLTTLMGGEITLVSDVGQGSTFTIILPLNPIQEGHHERATAGAGH